MVFALGILATVSIILAVVVVLLISEQQKHVKALEVLARRLGYEVGAFHSEVYLSPIAPDDIPVRKFDFQQFKISQHDRWSKLEAALKIEFVEEKSSTEPSHYKKK